MNLILKTDSYKHSQPFQYPGGMVSMFDYLASRGGLYSETVFVKLQYYMQKYLVKRIKPKHVKKAAKLAKKHGVSFDYDGWMFIAKKLKGRLPIKIRAVKEGSVIPAGHVLMTIESTNKRVPWVVTWAETLLMKLWYPITVASKSRAARLALKEVMEQYSDNTNVSFMFHNFGDRGSTCVEQAAIGGAAHLTQFLGTDNFDSLDFVDKYYNIKKLKDFIAGFSIDAGEHSTVTSWGREKELDMLMNHINSHYKHPMPIAAPVDSYNTFETTSNLTSGEFKEKIESDDYPVFVMRPDSGEPVKVVQQMLEICKENQISYTENSKGLKVFNKYRIIYGDGINSETMLEILQAGIDMGYAPDNFAFGSGGDLMQNVTRDTNKFAIKCSSIDLMIEKYGHNGEEIGTKIIKQDVYKDPITDPGKKSLTGELELVLRSNGQDSEPEMLTIRREDVLPNDVLLLEDTFKDGEILRLQQWDEVCSLACA